MPILINILTLAPETFKYKYEGMLLKLQDFNTRTRINLQNLELFNPLINAERIAIWSLRILKS